MLIFSFFPKKETEKPAMARQFDSHSVTSADYSVSMKVTSKIAFAGFLG